MRLKTMASPQCGGHVQAVCPQLAPELAWLSILWHVHLLTAQHQLKDAHVRENMANKKPRSKNDLMILK
jgi:hypothetical protein